MSTVEPIPVSAPSPATEVEVLPQHGRLGVSADDIDNAFLWCGLFQDAVRFETRMRDEIARTSGPSSWRTADGKPVTHTPQQQAQIAAIGSQEYGAAIRTKWESVEPYWNEMTYSCNLIDEMCNLEDPSLVDMTLSCNRFRDGGLPHPGGDFRDRETK